MPFELLDLQQVARYLNMDARELERLASRGKIPCERRKGAFVFRKIDVDHWVESRMHELPHGRLAQIESGVRAHHGLSSEDELLVAPMVPAGGIAIPLESRTGKSVIRNLIDLADGCGLVWGKDELLQAVEEREAMWSTALYPGLALPHPRHPLPWDIAESFIVAGRTASGVPFGAEDGSLTQLFFLVCCKDERTHLHVLARLARMLHDDSLAELREAPDADSFREILERYERQAQAGPAGGGR